MVKLISGKSLRDCPVVLENGTEIGRVSKAVYIAGEKRIRGLEYVKGLGRRMFLPADDIVRLGRTVIAHTEGIKRRDIKNAFAEEFAKPLDARVFDEEGREQGFVSDYYMDEKGHILTLEVSGGFFEDIVEGRELEQDFSRLERSGDIEVEGKEE